MNPTRPLPFTAPKLETTMNTTPPEDDESAEAEGRRMDAELRAMAALIRTLNALDEPARGRVVRWLADRYDANH